MIPFKEQLITIQDKYNKSISKHLELLNIKESCKNCGYFNLDITDPNMKYRCHVSGSCISATLNETITTQLWERYKQETEISNDRGTFDGKLKIIDFNDVPDNENTIQPNNTIWSEKVKMDRSVFHPDLSKIIPMTNVPVTDRNSTVDVIPYNRQMTNREFFKSSSYRQG
jgi:hypothetical protein